MLIGSEFELEAFAQSIQLLSMVETRNQALVVISQNLKL